MACIIGVHFLKRSQPRPTTDPDIQNQFITRIVVTGSPQQYTQFSNAAIDSLRPTVSWAGPTTIHLNCFPSRNLILHYASSVATYLSLCGRDPSIAIGQIDLAIVGSNNLPGLEGLTDHWHGEPLWGDTGNHFLRASYSYLNVKCVIYVAKCGSLSKGYTSNEWIAAETQAIFDGDVIQWPSPLDSVLDVSKKWLPQATWVDCVVGFMAKSAIELGVEFGYLLVVFDNLCEIGGENLSNEDLDIVSRKRKVLYDEIVKILNVLIDKGNIKQTI
ncbi:hypothetical protein GGR58DRAFT_518086 [Xylaria digitata]|nr:hypothetical protein GGR58DRAFT_518086 [Xylaria digitata]